MFTLHVRDNLQFFTNETQLHGVQIITMKEFNLLQEDTSHILIHVDEKTAPEPPTADECVPTQTHQYVPNPAHAP